MGGNGIVCPITRMYSGMGEEYTEELLKDTHEDMSKIGKEYTISREMSRS